MKDKIAKDILDRYREGTCTPEEKALVEFWAHQLNEDKAHHLSDTDLADVQKEMWRMVKPAGGSNKFLRWPAIAAAALILVSAAGIFYTLNKKAPSVTPQKTYGNVIKPGGNKAVLILADGKRIVLDDMSTGEIAQQSGIKISKKADGQLIYTVAGTNAQNDGKLVYNTIQTPRGGQYQINLPDGSKVWLNAESSLRFPIQFEKSKRAVELSGEGYFEVAHLETAKKERIPFQVSTTSKSEYTRGQLVEVLGTHFNINAYDDERAVITTLLEGSVRVTPSTKHNSAPKLLKPGQQSVLNQNNFAVTQADTEAAIAWKNGYFRFNDESLESIMHKVSKWYDVDVVYENDKLKKEPFAGVIARFANVSELLKMLALTGEVSFKIEGKKIIVQDKH
jgi:transmembrane sensor